LTFTTPLIPVSSITLHEGMVRAAQPLHIYRTREQNNFRQLYRMSCHYHQRAILTAVQALIAPYVTLTVWTMAAYKVSSSAALPRHAHILMYKSTWFPPYQAALSTSVYKGDFVPSAKYVYCRTPGNLSENVYVSSEFPFSECPTLFLCATFTFVATA
jgi:hypothetical protein